MAIRIGNRRRARFRRATSGNQDLTLLIYNLVKEQNAARKAALFAAFDANMASRSYDADYGGQPVDRAAVEAWYAQAIAAFPAGTTERDRLQAELIEFRTDAINKELSAYADAYKNGTYAFGRKINLNEYVRFLRDAEGLAPDAETKMKYTVERFIVEFNDVQDDLISKGASASTLLGFYRRQLNKADEMGITKSSDAYRDIRRYIRDTSKQAAAEGRKAAQEKAGRVISRRMAKVADSISSAIDAAFNAGRLDSATKMQLQERDGLDAVNAFLKLPVSVRTSILQAGASAGVQLAGTQLTGQGFYDYVLDTRDEIKTYANADWVDLETRTYLEGVLNDFDNTVLKGADLLTDTEKASDSGLRAKLASTRGLGSPLVNVEAYKAHARTLGSTSTGDVSSRAAIALLEGKVPNPRDFGGKTELSQLTQEEATYLTESFAGDLFIDGNPVDNVAMVIDSYRDIGRLQSGGYLIMTIDPNTGSPLIQVDDNLVPGANTYVMSVTIPGTGMRVSSAVQQVPRRLTNGSNINAQVIMELDQNNQIDYKVITPDGYKVDFDAYELWLSSTQGITPVFDGSNFVIDAPSAVLDASAMRSDSRFSSYVPNEPWNGLVVGSNGNQALEDIASDIASNYGSLFSLNADGTVSVTDPVRAAQETGLTQSGIDAIMKSEIGNRIINSSIQTEIRERSVQDFRMRERAEANGGTVPTQAEMDPVRLQAAAAAGQAFDAANPMLAQLRSPASWRTRMMEGDTNPYGGAWTWNRGQAATPPAGTPRLSSLPQNPFVSQMEEVQQQGVQARTNWRQLQTLNNPEQANKPTAPEDYFFRYSTLNVQPGTTPGTGFTPTSLGKAPSLVSPKAKSTFTTAEVNKSLIDFRAGERQSLGISSDTQTQRGR